MYIANSQCMYSTVPLTYTCAYENLRLFEWLVQNSEKYTTEYEITKRFDKKNNNRT